MEGSQSSEASLNNASDVGGVFQGPGPIHTAGWPLLSWTSHEISPGCKIKSTFSVFLVMSHTVYRDITYT